MKSVLVIDTPKNCVECKMSGLHGSWCHIIGDTYVKNGLDIADDCPLRLLPCKEPMRQMPSDVLEKGKRKRDFIIHKVDVDNSYIEGWNDCIDCILGELNG